MVALAQASGAFSLLSRRLPSIVSVILIVLIAHVLALLTWQIFAPQEQPLALTPQPTGTQARRIAPEPKYDWRIAQQHLFGRSTQPQLGEAPTAPETRLNLALRGVFASEDEKALAIIASGGATERFYRVGDNIAGGAILKAVYPDRVILERSLQLETLTLPKGKETGIQISRSEPASPPARNASDPVSGRAFNQVRTQVLKNPQQLGKMVQAVPASENGRFLGYRLSPRGNPTLFNQLGLQAGDVVTAVNGIAIDRPEKGLNALQNLVKADEVTVTLLRDGNEITVYHDLAQ